MEQNLEKTFLIVKPDGVGKKVLGEVIKRLESEGLTLVGLKMISPTINEIEDFYHTHKGKHFYQPLVNFMICGPIVVSVWESKDAVAKVRKIVGATNSKEADPGTLRRIYGTDNRRNLVHASDSPENAKREIEFFFKDKEIFHYSHDSWKDK